MAPSWAGKVVLAPTAFEQPQREYRCYLSTIEDMKIRALASDRGQPELVFSRREKAAKDDDDSWEVAA